MGRASVELESWLLTLWLLLCSWGCLASAELRAPPDKIGRPEGGGVGGRRSAAAAPRNSFRSLVVLASPRLSVSLRTGSCIPGQGEMPSRGRGGGGDHASYSSDLALGSGETRIPLATLLVLHLAETVGAQQTRHRPRGERAACLRRRGCDPSPSPLC